MLAILGELLIKSSGSNIFLQITAFSRGVLVWLNTDSLGHENLRFFNVSFFRFNFTAKETWSFWGLFLIQIAGFLVYYYLAEWNPWLLSQNMEILALWRSVLNRQWILPLHTVTIDFSPHVGIQELSLLRSHAVILSQLLFNLKFLFQALHLPLQHRNLGLVHLGLNMNWHVS